MILVVLVIGLAAYRLARALTVDSISEPFRRWLYVGAYGDDGTADDSGDGFWRWAYALCSCPFCASWWLALALYALWIWDGWGRRDLIGAIAAAGVAAILSALDKAAVGD